MKRHLTHLLLASLLAGCQSQQVQEASFATHAGANLRLLQYAAICTTRAEVYTRVENPLPGKKKKPGYSQLPEDELNQLKNLLKRAEVAPYAGKVPMNHWQQADFGIKLHGRSGELIFDLNEHTLRSQSDCQAHGSSLLCLSDDDMGKLMALPQYQAAREYKAREDEYARHCHRRLQAADELKRHLENTAEARLVLVNPEEDDEEDYTLEDEELEQLRQILSHAQPLPAMERHAWDTPEARCAPATPQQVYCSLQLLDDDDSVIATIPLDHQHFARTSELESYRMHEKHGEQIALPDDQHSAFMELSFWKELHALKSEMTE